MDTIEDLDKINDLENEMDIFDFLDIVLNKEEEILNNNEEKDNNNDEKSIKKEENKNKCANCKSINLVKNNGTIICSDCGIINEEVLDRGIEFANNENANTRVGCASNHFLPLSSMGTKIGGNKYTRMSLLQNRWYRMIYRERSLLNVLNDIERKCKEYGITKPIIDNSKILFKKINDSKHKYGKNKGKQIIIRGINRNSLIAACIYHGAEMHGIPRSQKEIAEICNLDVTNVTKGCRKFREILEDDDILQLLEPSDSIKYIERYSKKLDLEEKYIELCKTLSNNIKKLDIASDHQPPSIAAGSIILVSEVNDLNISIKDISSQFFISEVTIKKTFKKINEFKNILFDNDLVEQKLKELEDYYEKLKL